MRPGSFSDSSPSDRPRDRRDRNQPESARRAKLRRHALEGLEARTLLATVPPPAIIDRINVSNPSEGTDDDSDESAPSIAVDPTDASRLASAWTRFATDPDPDLIDVQARMSTDGGASWTGLAVPARRIDPSTGTNPQPYPNIDNASVAFARDGTFYLSLIHI